MPLPCFFHVGNSGGNSLVGAIGGYAKRDDIVVIDDPGAFEAIKPRLTPEYVAHLWLVRGHGIHYADHLLPNRYDITMLRWPRAHFNANVIYYNENPTPSAMTPIFGIADPYDRLRAYLSHLEAGGEPEQRMNAFDWLNDRHGLGCEPRPKRPERDARIDEFDAVLRDRYDLVAICELMDESLFLFHADFPDRPLIPWVRNLINKKRIDAFALPQDIVARIERENAAEFDLYFRARRRLLDRFVQFWKARPDMHDRYLIYKTAMILTDPLLKSRYGAHDPLYFPEELPLDDIRARVTALLPRQEEIRRRILQTYA